MTQQELFPTRRDAGSGYGEHIPLIRSTPALSIRQPWAWAILHAGKDIENRTWGTGYRGPLLIHAGKTVDDLAAWDWIEDISGMRPPVPQEIRRGGIVGMVEMVGCITEHPSAWFEGPVGFVLRNPRRLLFVPCRGQLGIFRVQEV